MSRNQPTRALKRRDDRQAITASIEEYEGHTFLSSDHDSPLDLPVDWYDDWFDRLYATSMAEEMRRECILSGHAPEGECLPFASSQEHRQAIIDLGHLWPSERAVHADTLARLGLT